MYLNQRLVAHINLKVVNVFRVLSTQIDKQHETSRDKRTRTSEKKKEKVRNGVINKIKLKRNTQRKISLAANAFGRDIKLRRTTFTADEKPCGYLHHIISMP